jgi:putative membrane protein
MRRGHDAICPAAPRLGTNTADESWLYADHLGAGGAKASNPAGVESPTGRDGARIPFGRESSRKQFACNAFGGNAPGEMDIMRYVYIGLIVLVTGLVLLFKFQNLETATISLFSASITLPMSVLVFLIYVLGMLTGGSLYALLKSWVRKARRPA